MQLFHEISLTELKSGLLLRIKLAFTRKGFGSSHHWSWQLVKQVDHWNNENTVELWQQLLGAKGGG